MFWRQIPSLTVDYALFVVRVGAGDEFCLRRGNVAGGVAVGEKDGPPCSISSSKVLPIRPRPMTAALYVDTDSPWMKDHVWIVFELLFAGCAGIVPEYSRLACFEVLSGALVSLLAGPLGLTPQAFAGRPVGAWVSLAFSASLR